MKSVIFSLLGLIIGLCLTALLVTKCEKAQDVLGLNPETITDTITVDSTKIVPTIEQVLQARKNVQLQKYADSVFLHMPDESLLSVLMKIGTESSIAEIVKEYDVDRRFHDNAYKVHKAAKELLPDTIPAKPAESKPTKSVN